MLLLPSVYDIGEGNLLVRIDRGAERTKATTSKMPWSHVVRIDLPGGRCTGTLLSQQIVITAAHCLHSEPLFPPDHITISYAPDDQPPQPIAKAAKYFYPDAWAKSKNAEQFRNDWAIIRLDRAITRAHFPALARTLPDLPVPVQQGGFGGPHANRLAIDDDCALRNRVDLVHDNLYQTNCLIIPGDSGGPLFFHDNGQWHLIAINIALWGLGDRQLLAMAVTLPKNDAFHQALVRMDTP
ncbi:MAG: trypsin-like serine protease [Pseudomonadota bacterium]